MAAQAVEIETFDPFEQEMEEPQSQRQADPFEEEGPAPAPSGRFQPRPQPQPLPLQRQPERLPSGVSPGLPPERPLAPRAPERPIAGDRSILLGQQECREEFEKLRASRITQIGLDIEVRGREGEDFPVECPISDEAFAGRHWHDMLYTWKASGLCHKPLYFNDDQVERYGHDWGPFIQPVISGAHFFATLPILPYKMGLETPDECIYALGHYRPGNCAPYMIEPLGFTWRAAAFQTGAVLGAVFLIP